VKVSIIIVNYNVRYFLEQALLSVQRAMAGLEAEVWVVDNHSVDDSVEMVRRDFPWVRLIANAHNPGFSIANNQAIRASTGEYVLLLNPDTVVQEDTLRQCVAYMDAHPDVGGLGVRMIDGAGNFLPESKRGLPTPWVAFAKAFGLSRLFPRSRVFNRYHLGYLSEHETHEIDVLAGAFMWLRRTVLDEIGLLDEQFFMYGEDIDLSYRIQRAGYRNVYFPRTSIIHYKGEST
jgi:GT2 family glycosyltransferase